MDFQAQEAIVQNAINLAGFGKFNIKVVILCALIYISSGFSMLNTGFVIPAAACDFKMTTIDKGRISTAPILGTCIGPFVWGFLADMKGRKFALLCALILQSFVEFTMSLLPYYWALVPLKFLAGFGMIGQLSVLFTYLGEFQPAKHQKKLLSLMDIALTMGLTLVPLLAWIVIPLKFEYRTEYFFFRSWNLFIMLCSIPPGLVAFWLTFFPETPKYLAKAGDNENLIRVLVNIHTENTKNTPKSYIDKLSSSEFVFLQQLASLYIKGGVSTVNNSVKGRTDLKVILTNFKKEAFNITKRPYLQRIILACSASFCITSAYYSFLLWFPEIFQRFAEFEAKYSNESLSVCTVSNRLHSIKPSENISNADPFSCDTQLDTTVYTHTLWQAIASIPTCIFLILFVDKLGFKFFMVTTSAMGGLTTLGLFFVQNSYQNLILACVFESLVSACMSVTYCYTVVIFPTNLRIFASTITVFSGRVGSLAGNVVFSYLIDDYCQILIFLVAIQFFMGSLLCLLIRKDDPKNSEV